MKNLFHAIPLLQPLLFVFFFCAPTLQAQPQLSWAKTLGGDTGFASQVSDQTGNIYSSGHFFGSLDFDTSPGGAFLMSSEDGQGFVMKMSASGAFLWAVQFHVQHPPRLALDADENLYVAANSHETKLLDLDPGPGEVWHENNIYGYADIFVVKLDPNGNYIWGKAMGSDYLDNVYGVESDPVNKGVYVQGTFYRQGDFDPGPDTFLLTAPVPDVTTSYVLRLDNDGEFEWAYVFGGNLKGIETNTDAGLFVIGNFWDTIDIDPGVGMFELMTETNSSYVLKLATDGTFMGGGSIASHATQDTRCTITDLAFDHEGNMYLAGEFSGEVDFDPGADIYNLPFTQNSNQSYVLKRGQAGELLWAKGYTWPPTSQGLYFNTLITDAESNLYLSGQFYGTVDFDPGAGEQNLTAIGQKSDAFVSKLLPDGQFGWSFRIGGNGYDNCNGLDIDLNQQLNISGQFSGSADFDPGPGVKTLIGGTYGSAFLAKYSGLSTSVFQPEQAATFSVFPNPANDWIQLPAAIEGGFLSIFDELGNLSVRQLLVRESEQIYIGGLPQGNYTIFVEGGEKRQVAKFLKLQG